MSAPQLSSIPRHPVRRVAALTGLTPHVLRAWERRYGTVAPARSDGGQRLYSDADVERLRLLRQLTERGHPIGQLAGMSVDDLRSRVLEEERVIHVPGAPAVVTNGSDDVQAALDATDRMDEVELQGILERAAVAMGAPAFLDEVAGPMIRHIGEQWSLGRLCVAHEHLATAVIRRVLGGLVARLSSAWATAPGAPRRPRLVVATPPRQVHELGALLAAATAAAEGWHVTYLGADLPAAEIALAVRKTRADGVVLSIVYPANDPALAAELSALRTELPSSVPMFIGGRSARAYGPALAAAALPGAEILDSLPALRSRLRGFALIRQWTS